MISFLFSFNFFFIILKKDSQLINCILPCLIESFLLLTIHRYVVIPVLKNNLSGNETTHSNISFSIIHFLISDSPLPLSPVNNGEPLNTIPIRLPFDSILEIIC